MGSLEPTGLVGWLDEKAGCALDKRVEAFFRLDFFVSRQKVRELEVYHFVDL
jgi:hypothetical protein